MKVLKKDPVHKKIMATQDDFVNNDMFDPYKAIGFSETAFRRSGRFPEQ